jgi:hypothetical protein
MSPGRARASSLRTDSSNAPPARPSAESISRQPPKVKKRRRRMVSASDGRAKAAIAGQHSQRVAKSSGLDRGSSMGSGVVTRLVRVPAPRPGGAGRWAADRADRGNAGAGRRNLDSSPRARAPREENSTPKPRRDRPKTGGGVPRSCRTRLTANAHPSNAALANHARSFDTSACHEEPVGHRPEYDGSRSRCRAQLGARAG